VLADPASASMIKQLNPDFAFPSRPFRRMDYKEAIKWLNEHSILTDEGKEHVVGDDIAEAAERRMTDALNVPIFLTGFPREIKSFYMKRVPGDEHFTESVDVLMPGVGEIVGGSMRMSDPDELLQAYKNEGIDAKPYHWYTDQRKYGTCEHGGYGLGVERFLAWLTNRYTCVRPCSFAHAASADACPQRPRGLAVPPLDRALHAVSGRCSRHIELLPSLPLLALCAAAQYKTVSGRRS
jgi:asparaginyl-tRNA synthetase